MFQGENEHSKISITLLQNYLLALHLMKNIANRYSIDRTDEFDLIVAQDLKKIREFDYFMKLTQAPPAPQKSPKIING